MRRLQPDDLIAWGAGLIVFGIGLALVLSATCCKYVVPPPKPPVENWVYVNAETTYYNLWTTRAMRVIKLRYVRVDAPR